MKQGMGKSSMSAGKVEPGVRVVSVAAVSDIGAHQMRTSPKPLFKSEGFKAPGIKSQSHKNGSQGTY